MVRSLKANQTIFNIDSNWFAVYHSLYPAFIRNEKLYLSANIGTKNKIKNHHISSFFQLLNEVEVIGKKLAQDVDISDFQKIYDQSLENDEITITTKAQFNSPGEIWNDITKMAGSVDLTNEFTLIVVAYAMIFGNSKLGFDGLVDLKTRQKIWDKILERKKENNATEVVEELNMKLPDSDTKALEDDSNDEDK